MASLAGALLAATSGAQANPSCDARPGADIYSAKCATCHSIVKDQPGTVGPSLWGVIGRRPASERGFAYSAAMSARKDRWSPAVIDWFLTDPPGRVPGTYMAFSGLKDAAARAAVICFLGTTSAHLK
ncbi:c-type cytochrome [Phenylobacterium montanum]|uniref:C-type cytochrome n=1 Tax=Phenylobacterium montanum TaxID=2823693 RepID=A0A975G447_9CAUL|nr:c-type cytochrome [Caulobacter sp. S6]QUD90306.1 c-type cytochrome [Caulobacter sp. S6]